MMHVTGTPRQNQMRHKAIILGVCLMLMTPQTIYADSNDYQTEVVNHIRMGDISISLENFGEDELGNLIPYQNPSSILPGQKLNKIIQITNHANPAWVRVKLECTSKDGSEDLSDQLVTLTDEENWKKAGGYYYYTKPMERSEMVTFTDTVRIPPEWDNSYAGRIFSIMITADAVQKDNFTPDFTQDDPWFGTIIETCVHSDYTASTQEQTAFSVAFEGGAEGLVKIGEDFFSNFGELMPGDTVSDEVTILNKYNRPVQIFFRTETIVKDELFEKLTLEIKNEDTVLYAGTLQGAITEATQLALLNSGESTRLNYTLHVPPELNNQYAKSETKTKWIFSAEIVIANNPGGDSGDPNDSPSDSGDSNDSPGVWENIIQIPPLQEIIQEIVETGEAFLNLLPDTGDRSKTWIAVIFMFVSGIGVVIMIRILRKEKKREK